VKAAGTLDCNQNFNDGLRWCLNQVLEGGAVFDNTSLENVQLVSSGDTAVYKFAPLTRELVHRRIDIEHNLWITRDRLCTDFSTILTELSRLLNQRETFPP
jgi:hypothetical protein